MSTKKSITPPPQRARRWRKPAVGAGGILAIVAISLGFALPDTKKPAAAVPGVSRGVAPAFSERDVVHGRPLTSAALRGRNVLLFFSEGVMCQACFEQIQSLEARAAELRARRLTLVNITTDPADVARQAAARYGIGTPLISDEDGNMSTAYGAIGRGMHPSTDGHTFVLVDRTGRIRWRRDYTTMFVPAAKLLAAIPTVK